ncbi:alpha/beta hydrolase [Nocardiopsis alba]|uniref:alpha/beta fold hydrolase n=1 Tax=Nocardiopsis alba TaxID=53437 RepID=UPI0033F69F3E
MDPGRIAFERHGNGRPVVLLHGLGDRRQSWRSVSPRLVDHYEVFSLDLPGFGESPAPGPKEHYDVYSLVRVVRDFCELHGIERPHLAGNSLGGSIALELGVQGVAGSVTVFSPAGFSDTLARWGMRTVGMVANLATRLPMPLKERLADTPPARAAARIALRGDPSSPEAKATRFGVQGLEPGAPYVRMVPKIADYDFSARPIGCPVTIAWGDRDRTLLPSSAEHAHQRVPNARMVSMLGVGHIPMADDPLTVAEHIRWTCNAADRGPHEHPWLRPLR